MRDRARPHGRLLTLALLLCAPLSLAFWDGKATRAGAQTTVTGAFAGTVTDRARAPVRNAVVEIRNLKTGHTFTPPVDHKGIFSQDRLPPGRYVISVRAPGYISVVKRQRLKVLVPNQVIPIPITLDAEGFTPPTTAARPTPTAPPPLLTVVPAADPDGDESIVADLNRTDARLAGDFSEEEVALLPLGAATFTRSYDELALLLPGVAPPPQTPGDVAGPGVGPGVGSAGQFAVHGLRSRANNFTVDGSDNNDEDVGVRRQGFLALVPQPVESIQEYQVITLLAPAQFGRNLGAQVNAISKSGGAETHGSLYGMFNSSHLNARNFFDAEGADAAAVPLHAGGRPVLVNGRPALVSDPSGEEDSFTFGSGGLTLGGPLSEHRGEARGRSLFYFVSAEGALLNATRETSFAVPTVEQRGLFGSGARGLSTDPFDGSAIEGFPTTVSGDAVFSLFPFPNNPGGVYGENTFTQVLPAGGQGKIVSGKLDANFKLRRREQSFTARYNFTDDYRDIPAVGGAIFSTTRPRVRTQNFSTYLNSELSDPRSTAPVSNQLRASYGRTRLVFDEVRDASFLLPSRLAATLGPVGSRFLLNAPLRANDTLPTSPNVLYDNFFNFGVEDVLGPVGQVHIAGFSPVGVEVFNFPQHRVNNTYQLADDLTWRKATHSLVFGADLRRTELNSDLPRNARPLITFYGAPRLGLDASGGAALQGFFNPVDLAAASAPSGVFQAVTPGAGSAIALRYYQHNYFAQDSWRLRHDLTLSFGLRYEYNTPPRETSRRIESAFDDPALQLVPGLRSLLDGRAAIFDPDRNNFAPRVGAVYAPRLLGPERTTLLRAGFGVYYDQALGAVVSQSRNVFPNFLTLNFAGGVPGGGGLGFNIADPSLPFFPCRDEGGVISFFPVTRSGTLNALNPDVPLRCLVDINASFPGGFGFTLPARRFEMPTAYHYAVSFEQEFTPEIVASVAYVGTLGRQLPRLTTPNLGPNAFLVPVRVDINANQPNVSGVALGPGQRLDAGGTVVGGRPVAGAGAVYVYESSAGSRYDALQVQVRARLGRAIQYQAAYVLSRADDDVSDIFDLAGAPALPQNSLTFAGERGPANFDARHRLTYHFTYDFSGARSRLLRGLQLAGTGRLQTGQPFTVNSIFDVNLDGNLTDRPDAAAGIVRTGDPGRPLRLTADPLTLLAPVGQDGRLPRNTFRAGGLVELDLAVVKSFKVRGGQRLLVRADIFNFINHTNFDVPVRFLEAPGFGRATETATPGRRLQFALKYLF
jgi:hypothetical protein